MKANFHYLNQAMMYHARADNATSYTLMYALATVITTNGFSAIAQVPDVMKTELLKIFPQAANECLHLRAFTPMIIEKPMVTTLREIKDVETWKGIRERSREYMRHFERELEWFAKQNKADLPEGYEPG
jgi:hypothetical protein